MPHILEESPVIPAPPAAVRVPALVAALTARFDSDEPTVLVWLNAQHGLMVKRASCYRKRIGLGNTVAAQSSYTLPADVIRVLELLVGGVPYGRGEHSDIAASAQHWLFISGLGGVSAEDSDAAGAEQLALVPAPVEGGAAIEIWAACRPPALSVSDDTTLKIPPEFDDALLAGAMGVGMETLEARFDLAANFNAKYEAGCTELLREVRKRYRPREARVTDYNA